MVNTRRQLREAEELKHRQAQDANNNPRSESQALVMTPRPPGTESTPGAQGLIQEAVSPTNGLWKNPEKGKCQFCLMDVNVGDGVLLQECLHTFCRDCLESAIEMQTEVAKVPCPFSGDKKCDGFLTDAEVKELVRPDVYEKYIDRSLVIARKKMKNVFTCNTKHCEGWCEIEENRKSFTCPVCHKMNCIECNAIHVGVTCEVFTQLTNSGQHAKLKELMDKEENSGWCQLLDYMKVSENPNSGMIQSDLISNTRKFDCPVCFCDIDPGEGIILQECLHCFCKTCLINLVNHNDDALVKCPYIDGNYSCICYLQACEIKALVPEDMYEKHLQRSVKLGESRIENSFHCKTPDCPGWCEYGEGATRFKCPICKKPNCIPCMAIHKGSCEDYKNSLDQDKNNKLSEEAVESLIKSGKYMKCPKCKIPVEKIAGCDWLQCTSCRTEICWATKGPRWGPRGYGDTTGGCRCRLNGKKCHPKCSNCH